MSGENPDDDERGIARMAKVLGYAQVRSLTVQLLGGPPGHDPDEGRDCEIPP